MSDSPHDRLARYDRWVIRLLWLGVFVAALAFVMEVAAAQATPTPTPGNVSEVAGYYNDSDTSVGNTSWLANRSDPTLQNVSYWAVVSGGWIIGDGSGAPGGIGLAGPLVLGVTLGGALLLGPISRARVGPVAGAVLVVTLLFGVTSAALAPVWLVPIGLFVLGLVASAVVISILR